MKKYTKGAILKKRIKEMGYTQQKFSEETGIPIATLKKYLSDKSVYTIDLLELFSKKLDCSYDYLMGYSVSPNRNFQSVKDATRLSDEAISYLQDIALLYEEEENNKFVIDALSEIIEEEGLVNILANYIYEPKEVGVMYEKLGKTMYDAGIEMRIDYNASSMIAVINALNLMRVKKRRM